MLFSSFAIYVWYEGMKCLSICLVKYRHKYVKILNNIIEKTIFTLYIIHNAKYTDDVYN